MFPKNYHGFGVVRQAGNAGSNLHREVGLQPEANLNMGISAAKSCGIGEGSIVLPVVSGFRWFSAGNELESSDRLWFLVSLRESPPVDSHPEKVIPYKVSPVSFLGHREIQMTHRCGGCLDLI